MTMALTEDTGITGLQDLDKPQILEMLGQAVNHVELLQESVADLEFAAEDRGWQRMSFGAEQEFTRAGLANIARNARLMAIASPLIKRGVQLRIGYVWGQGVTIQARAGEDAEQDVNAVIQDWWDDEGNKRELTGSQAQEDNERSVATEGNLSIACFTNPLTGRVQVRIVPFEEMADIFRNPEDRSEDWFYLRQYDATVIEPGYAGGTRTRQETRRVLHPALGYRPTVRPRVINGLPVMWDAPILHVAVNRPKGWKWGIPDVYAALPWARAYDGFLTDWARLVKALSKFAWKLTGDRSSKARVAASRIASVLPGAVGVPPRGAGLQSPGVNDGPIGTVAAMGPGANLEAIPKSGATIDSESGRPIAAMVAAGLGVSVVDLLADPGVTGARAVAETMDKGTVLEAGMRRSMWGAVFQTLTSYVIDQAVIAPRGPLKGSTARDDDGRLVVTLDGDVERTVTVDWPDLNELDPVQLVTAIAAAEGTGVMPPKETLRLLLHALRVKDVDEVIEANSDEQGNLITPAASAGQAAVDAFRNGEDPASKVA